MKRASPLALVLAGLVAAAGCGQERPAAPSSTPSPSPSPGQSGDWPMYGQNLGRSCYNASETRIGVANLGQLAALFQANVGMGAIPSSSGPVVASGRVFVGSSVLQGDNYFCFDARTGAPIWSANIGQSPPFQGNVGVGSTAAVVDGVVFVGGGDAAYYALSAATGAIVWRHAMNVGPDPFAWSSPLVANGLAYVGMSSRYDAVRGELRALDVRDGSIRARQYFVPEGRRGADIWNSPALSPGGEAVVVATGNDFGGFDGALTRAIVALDPATLAIQAVDKEASFNQDLDFGTTPVFFSDAGHRTLVGATEKNGTFFAYELGRLSDGPLWQRHTGLSVGTLPAYDPNSGPGGTLFIVGDSGLLFAVDPATGNDRFPPVATGFTTGNIALANGLAFVGSGGGVAVLDAANGNVLRVLTPTGTGRSFSGVVVSGGVVYWMTGPTLNAWGIQ